MVRLLYVSSKCPSNDPGPSRPDNQPPHFYRFRCSRISVRFACFLSVNSEISTNFCPVHWPGNSGPEFAISWKYINLLVNLNFDFNADFESLTKRSAIALGGFTLNASEWFNKMYKYGLFMSKYFNTV